MSFSLYGALPPSKSGKNTEKKENTTPASSGAGLYSSLPAPEAGSTVFKKDPSTPSVANTPPTSETAPTKENTSNNTTPAGWSAFNKFRPVLRRPTIQAKPKLNKTFIPTGATIVSEKTITKEEIELEQAKAQAQLKAEEKQKSQQQDNIDLSALPLLTSADDVNGFRAIHKSKKKGKKGKQSNAPTQPLPMNMLEDYDPHRPNDYEQYKEERRELREKQRRKRDWEKRRDASVARSRSRSWSRSPSRSPSKQRSRSRSPYYRSRSPTPEQYRSNIPPPSTEPAVKINVNETADDAYMRRLKMSQQQQQPQVNQSRQEEAHPAHEIARKLLNKHGWHEGQSLGRDKEISKEPLQAQAFGHGSGTTANNNNNHLLHPQPEKPVVRSKVILLTNMVGPGEVDDLLQEETADECSKYGKVERCLIFEVPRGKIPDDRAVRIFVKFSNIESAEKAINDLNGRFFGGRVVNASFFDTLRFEKLDLAPSKEEYNM